MNDAMTGRLPALDLQAPPTGTQRLYAIADEGFAWRQGSVYFGDPARVDAVTCVLAAQRLATELPWFSRCVRDIRMLRIEENNDLGPAVGFS